MRRERQSRRMHARDRRRVRKWLVRTAGSAGLWAERGAADRYVLTGRVGAAYAYGASVPRRFRRIAAALAAERERIIRVFFMQDGAQEAFEARYVSAGYNAPGYRSPIGRVLSVDDDGVATIEVGVMPAEPVSYITTEVRICPTQEEF